MALIKRIDTSPLGPTIWIYDTKPAIADAMKDGVEPGDLLQVQNVGWFVMDTDHSLRELASFAGVTPNVNTEGGIPVIHRINAVALTGDVDVVLVNKTRVIEVWAVHTAVAGVGDTITVKNGANAITNALDFNVADQTVVRATTIDDAFHEIAAGGTLRITGASAVDAIVYVMGLRVA